MMVWWRFDLQKCRYLFSQLPLPSSNSEKDFLSFVSPFFSWYYFSILFSLSLAPKPQSHADWVADQFKQRGFSAAKRRLAGVLWSVQYFVCGHTIKDLGVAIGRMWKSDPGSPHPTNSVSFLLFFSFSSMFLPSFLVFVSLHLSPVMTLPPFMPPLPYPLLSVTLSFLSSPSCLSFLSSSSSSSGPHLSSPHLRIYPLLVLACLSLPFPPSHKSHSVTRSPLFLSLLQIEATPLLICLEQTVRFSSLLPLPLPIDAELGEGERGRIALVREVCMAEMDVEVEGALQNHIPSYILTH